MDENYQLISDYLQPVLPRAWSKVCLYAEVTDSYSEIFYYCFVDGQIMPIQCYNLVDSYRLTEESIDAVLSKIANVLKGYWLNATDKWSVMTYVLFPDGKFEVIYDYSDLTDGSYEFKEDWKKKHLTNP